MVNEQDRSKETSWKNTRYDRILSFIKKKCIIFNNTL